MIKPCATCPFLECNRNRPTPTDFKCVEDNETDWYSQANIDGVWEVMRTSPITFLSCHSTDPDYYGKDGHPIFACVGATLGVYIHLAILDSVKVYPKYVEIVTPQIAMLQKVMLEKAVAFAKGHTSIHWGGMKIAPTINADLSLIRWPTGFEPTIQFFKTIYK